MKNIHSEFEKRAAAVLLLSGLVLLIVVLMISCSKSSPTPVTPPTAVQANTQLMTANTWKIQSVLVDGVDKTSSFTGMTLKFTSSGFSVASGNVVWPGSGTWSFTDATATAFNRDDGITVSITTLTATALQISLTWTKTTLGPGRVSAVAGQYVFTFTN